MPTLGLFPNNLAGNASWRVEGGAQVIALETAVKDGILGGGGDTGGAIPTGKDVILGAAIEKLDLKKMIEELDSANGEDVPSVFICPISLEPMVDPVTLCTGQTYERVHILKWFSLEHLTRTTTMQELWDDAVTPNRTLHRLIQAWFSQCKYTLALVDFAVHEGEVGIAMGDAAGVGVVQRGDELLEVVPSNTGEQVAAWSVLHDEEKN
ncbi:hypothetical protein Cni_G15205 [Canna indica]|uniref:U-box domain-containing protein n=1 Tax=Canna indica TaxID=4628 RepID=A0AAQ3QBC5_9LILI|nr:hypothetical protein Cni_G15205 [Canna indica]